jgi:hypothetical protein
MITGALGAVVSTVTANAVEAELTFPAVSLAVALKLWLPSAKVVPV